MLDITWWPFSHAAVADPLRSLLTAAAAAWGEAGHPGWSMLPITTSHIPGALDAEPDGPPTTSFAALRTATGSEGAGWGDEGGARPFAAMVPCVVEAWGLASLPRSVFLVPGSDSAGLTPVSLQQQQASAVAGASPSAAAPGVRSLGSPQMSRFARFRSRRKASPPSA